MVRRLRYNVAMSLDGYIAGPNGEYDWITMDPAIDFAALFSEFDCFVMGRKTFETLQAQKHNNPLQGLKIIVFSTTMSPDQYPEAIISNHPVETIAKLKAEPGKDIWLFGGGTLFRNLLDAHLVDIVEVAIMPILLGNGIPLLPAGKRSHRLHLSGSKSLPSGILLTTYTVQKGDQR